MLTASCLLMLPCARMRIGGRGKKEQDKSFCLSICLSICLSVCLSIHLSTCLSPSACAYLVVLPDQESMELGEEG